MHMEGKGIEEGGYVEEISVFHAQQNDYGPHNILYILGITGTEAFLKIANMKK